MEAIIPAPPVPNDHIAIDAIKQAIAVLQSEQSQSPTRKRAIVITSLETALLWQKNFMGLIED